MILFTRAVARDFHMLFSRCMAGRPRRPASPVLIEVKDGVRTIAATSPDGITLTHTSSAQKEADDFLVILSAAMVEVEGGTDEVVTLDRESKLRGAVKWQSGVKPRTQSVELILPGKQHQIPPLPKFASVNRKFLPALYECGRTTAQENGCYAISRVQIQDKAGRVVGTNGKVALVWNDFDFLFTDDVLVSALPVFGSKPLARITEVKIGHMTTHLVVVANPWAVWLPTDAKAKYPDVANVIPRHPPTTITIDDSDAAMLLSQLPGLPGNDHDLRPITLDADYVVCVRGRVESGEKISKTKEIPLVRSTVTAPALRVALDRRVFIRALSLGCRTFKLTPAKPVVAHAEELTIIVAQLDPVLIAPLPNEAESVSAVSTSSNAKLDDPERSDAVKPTEANSHPSRDELPDPLTLAEELRDALATATTKAARLVGVLRLSNKEKKALSVVLSGLKQLNLGTGDNR